MSTETRHTSLSLSDALAPTAAPPRRIVHRSPLPDVRIPNVPLGDYVFEHARQWPDRVAIVDSVTAEALTYREVCQHVERLSAALAARGLGQGDVVAIYAPNVPLYPVVFHAAARAGCTVTTANPLFTAGELAHQLRDSAARLLFTTDELLTTAREAVRQTRVEETVTFGGAPGATPLSALLADAGRVPDPAIESASDIVALPYSSGAIGLPKGVRLAHRNVIANIVHMERVESFEHDEVFIAALPFHHMLGLVAVMNFSLRTGGTIVTMRSFSAPAFMEALERYRVTTAFLVPPLVRILARDPMVALRDLSALENVVSGAGSLPDADARACAARLHCTVRQVYGTTETSAITHLMPRRWSVTSAGSVGCAVPNTECRIVDIDGAMDLEPEQIGEVWVRGPQVMRGYLNQPEATATMVDEDGWLHTGDIGHVDKNGLLFVAEGARELAKFRSLHYESHDLRRALAEDVAARRASEQLAASQAMLLDSVREAVVATSLECRVTFWNKGAEALFGYSVDEAVGQTLGSLIFPHYNVVDDAVTHQQIEFLNHGKAEGPIRRRRKDGTVFWADRMVSWLTDAEGQRNGYVAIYRDITELRRSQEELRDSRERLRNLAASLMGVREHERAELSRELHDELGQALTRLTIDLTWLLDQLPPERRTARADAMVPLVGHMLQTVQHISAGLRPAVLDDLGLGAAIEWQGTEFSKWNGCQCKLDLRIDALKPHRDRDIAVFRIVQEALTNVARHARAKRVLVRAHLRQRTLLVEVRDDGIGLPDDRATSVHSLGLIGMQERAERVGGQVRFVRARAGGTLVRLQVPLNSA